MLCLATATYNFKWVETTRICLKQHNQANIIIFILSAWQT